MILNGIMAASAALFGTFLSIFPQADSATVAAITSNVSGFRSAIAGANWIFPVDTLFLFLSIIITIEGLVLSSKLIRYIISLLTLGFIH